MSTAEFGDPNVEQPPVATPATGGLVSPLSISAAAPVEPLAQPTPPITHQVPQPLAPAAPLAATPPAIAVAEMRDVPLGTLIFRAGLLTEEHLEEALQDGMQRGKRLGEVLLERGLVSEENLGRLLAGQKGLRFVELDAAAVDPAAVQLLPIEKARLYSVLPIGFQDGLPVVAVVDPSNDLVVENVRRALNCEPHLVVAGREALHRQIEVAYASVPPVAPVETPQFPSAVEPVAAAPSEQVVQVAPPPVVQTVEPPVASVEPVNGDGLWLGAPEVALQPEPVAVQAPEPLPLVAEPMPPVEPTTPVEPLIPMEPVAPLEPVAVEPVLQTPPVHQPVPDPVAISFTPVAPVEEPVLQAAPLPSVVQTEPLLEQPAPNPDEDTVVTWSVVIRLADGDRVEIGAFHSTGEARDHAQNIVRQISSERGWPFFGGRFIRPEAIISVDLTEPEGRWLGSVARRQAWTSDKQQG